MNYPEKFPLLAQIPQRESPVFVAIDLGSNSFHMLACRVVDDSYQIISSLKSRVQLAQGLSRNLELSENAIQKGLDCLREFKLHLQSYRQAEIRLVATFTLRQAKNSADFCKRAQEIFDQKIEIISGDEEARLIYSGVAHNNNLTNNTLVFDIGGGSTEFIIGTGFETHLRYSSHMGCVSFQQKYFSTEKERSNAFKKAYLAAVGKLNTFKNRFLALKHTKTLASSGTIKALMNLSGEFESGKLTHSDLLKLKNTYIKKGSFPTAKKLDLSDERLSVIPSGLAITLAIFDSFELTEVFYSAAALRDGIIHEMFDRQHNHDIREKTAASLAKRYNLDINHARILKKTTLLIYEQIATDWNIDSPEAKSLLTWAAFLQEIGLHIAYKGIHHHGSYIINNSNLPGFNFDEQKLLAALVLNQHKKINSKPLLNQSHIEPKTALKMACILRLALILCKNKRWTEIDIPKITVAKKKISLAFEKHYLKKETILNVLLEEEKSRLNKIDIDLQFT